MVQLLRKLFEKARFTTNYTLSAKLDELSAQLGISRQACNVHLRRLKHRGYIRTGRAARAGYPKPVVAFIAGRSAPSEKRMGHACAIIMGNADTADSKIKAFGKVGVKVAEKPSDVAKLLAHAMTT